MAQEYYPPVGFYFTVSFDGGDSGADARFKEVSGLKMEMGVEEIAEGGENRFKHRIPSRGKFANLVMKRGMLTSNTPITTWINDTISGGLAQQIQTKTIFVSLLGEDNQPLAKWTFVNAWPVKWDISSLDSMKNEYVVESLEFAYSYFTSALTGNNPNQN